MFSSLNVNVYYQQTVSLKAHNKFFASGTLAHHPRFRIQTDCCTPAVYGMQDARDHYAVAH